MLLETAEFKLPCSTPDRVVMYIPGLKGARARVVANAAVAEARRKMPKMSGYSANRMQPIYGKDYFGIRWADCLALGTRVLKADWTWVPVETLVAGDELIAFDEEVPDGDVGLRGRGRRYRTGTVTGAFIDRRESVRVTFDDGTSIVATKSHPWLVKHGTYPARRWVESKDLTQQDTLGVYFDVWDTQCSFDSGWVSGMFDGEGSYVNSANRKRDGSPGLGRYLSVAQKRGPILDQVERLLRADGFSTRDRSPNSDVAHLEITGGFAEQVRFLGGYRPMRLLPKIEHDGRAMEALRERRVVSVEEVGHQDVMVLETTTQTYLAEGMGSHNSYVWFQDHGIRSFTMNNLANKTVPMWIDDPSGLERQKNPKAKTRVTMSGKTQVLIFRRAAEKGKRIVKYGRNKVTGQREVISDRPASYPGAPGRIAVREAGAPLTTPGRVAGAVARGNVGVRWRHPGIAPRLFLNNAMTVAAQRHGILPVRVYIGDQRWSQFVHGMERGR